MIDPESLPLRTDAFLDRIVDGSLTPTQLREAVDRLEREPEGWKRCALAFLEAQCWRESFRSMEHASQALPRVVAPTARLRPSPARRSATTWRTIAMAAGIGAISFVLGWRTHPARTPLLESAPSHPATLNQGPHTDVARTGDLPDLIEGPSEPPWDGHLPRLTAPPIVTVGRLRVGPSEDAPTVPIIGGTGIDEQWVSNQPPPITEHQEALLEQHGYQVDRRRRLVTATLRDGRRVAVPVDRFDVRYTGMDPL
jgi:hypothetical protein